MKNLILCPSILNLDPADLREELPKINASGVDMLHLDLMDGSFVPNFGLSLREIASVRKLTDLPIDCHMMIDAPHRYVERVAKLGVNICYIHPESEKIPSATLEMIAELGMSPGLVLNPCTSISQVEDMLPIIDYLMVMGVNPGFAGRDFMDYLLPKFKRIAALREERALEFSIILDGGTTMAVMEETYRSCGVDGFVLGKQEYFFQERSYDESVKLIRDTLGKYANEGQLLFERAVAASA